MLKLFKMLIYRTDADAWNFVIFLWNTAMIPYSFGLYTGRPVEKCHDESLIKTVKIGIVTLWDLDDPYNSLLNHGPEMLLRDRFGKVYPFTEFDRPDPPMVVCYRFLFTRFSVIEPLSQFLNEPVIHWYEASGINDVDFLVGSFVPSAAAISELKNIPYFVITPMDNIEQENLRESDQITGPIVNVQPMASQTWQAVADLLLYAKSRRVLLLYDYHHIVEVEEVKIHLLKYPGWVVQNIYQTLIRGTKIQSHLRDPYYVIGEDPDSSDDIHYKLRSLDLDTIVFFFHRTYRWKMITELTIHIDTSGIRSYTWICGSVVGPGPLEPVDFPVTQTLYKLLTVQIDVPEAFLKKDSPPESNKVLVRAEVDFFLLQFSHLMRRVLATFGSDFSGMKFYSAVISNAKNMSTLTDPTCASGIDPIRLIFDDRGLRVKPKLAVAIITDSTTPVDVYWQNSNTSESRFLSNGLCAAVGDVVHLKILPLIEAPYLMKVEDPLQVLHGNSKFQGLLLDVLNRVEDYLLSEYGIRLHVELDDKATQRTGGKKLPNGIWNGAIGELIRSGDYMNQYQFILGATTKTVERMKVVGFLPGFVFDGITAIYRPKRRENYLYSFLKPFDYDAWAVILAAIVLSLIHLRLLYAWDPLKDAQVDTDRNFRLKAVLWYSYGTAFQNGAPYEPVSVPMRIYTVSLMFFASVVIGCYTGNMARFLTEVAYVESIQKLTDFAADQQQQEEYWYGAVAGSSVDSFFANSADPVYAEMGRLMRERGLLVESVDVGLEMVRNSTDEKPFAFIDRSQSLHAHRAVYALCDLEIMKAQVSVQEISIAIDENFPLRDPFRRALNAIIASGEMHDLLNYWTVAKDPCIGQRSYKPQQISYYHFSGPLLMLAASIPISLIFIIVKLVHYKRTGLDVNYVGRDGGKLTAPKCDCVR